MSSTLLLGKLALITGNNKIININLLNFYYFFYCWNLGAGSGIGRATAIRFAQEGCTVIAADRNLARAEETAKKLGGKKKNF